MITLALVFISFLIWNIFNEVLINISDPTYNRKWHTYDSIFRVVLFSIIAIDKFGFTIYTGQVVLASLFIYHILFDIGYNYRKITIVHASKSLDNIFHLGTNPIDKSIIWVAKVIKVDKTKVNITIKIIELIISTILLLWT
jgi:hypothetical protein